MLFQTSVKSYRRKHVLQLVKLIRQRRLKNFAFWVQRVIHQLGELGLSAHNLRMFKEATSISQKYISLDLRGASKYISREGIEGALEEARQERSRKITKEERRKKRAKEQEGKKRERERRKGRKNKPNTPADIETADRPGERTSRRGITGINTSRNYRARGDIYLCVYLALPRSGRAAKVSLLRERAMKKERERKGRGGHNCTRARAREYTLLLATQLRTHARMHATHACF